MEYKIYCDLDGVLADFESGVKRVTGKYPNQQSLGRMWSMAAKSNDFFYNLDFMPDAEELWNYIVKHDPIILTGMPMGKWASGQKKRWVGDNLGWEFECITTMTSNKHLHSEEGHVLIDDREKTKSSWENAGGIFIHHTSAELSILELKELGL